MEKYGLDMIVGRDASGREALSSQAEGEEIGGINDKGAARFLEGLRRHTGMPGSAAGAACTAHTTGLWRVERALGGPAPGGGAADGPLTSWHPPRPPGARALGAGRDPRTLPARRRRASRPSSWPRYRRTRVNFRTQTMRAPAGHPRDPAAAVRGGRQGRAARRSAGLGGVGPGRVEFYALHQILDVLYALPFFDILGIRLPGAVDKRLVRHVPAVVQP